VYSIRRHAIVGGFHVITVSEKVDGTAEDDANHVDTSFSTRTTELEERIARERRSKRFDRIVVALDWYWLQKNYYETRYGANWLTPYPRRENPGKVSDAKAHKLLAAGASEVILPVDNGTTNGKGKGSLMRYVMLPALERAMRRAKEGAGTTRVEYITKEENLFWTTTRAFGTGVLMDKGPLVEFDEEQMKQYTDPTRPFVRITQSAKYARAD